MSSVKHTIEHVKQRAKEKGIECVSNEYTGVYNNLTWKCALGHIWESSYNQVINCDHGCTICRGGVKNHDDSFLIELANQHDGYCLSEHYTNYKAKVLWRCKFGHQFLANCSNVKYGFWCPVCGGSKRKTIEDMRHAAEQHEGFCLSTEYKNNGEKLTWKCKFGHTWEDNYGHIQQGRWCPRCSMSQPQQKIYYILRKLFPDHETCVDFKQFAWLKTKRYGKQELDLYIPKLKLAIEYDGEQHFWPVQFGGMSLKQAKKNFTKQKKRDELKNKKITEHPEDVQYFVRFNYKEDITEELIVKKLKEIGVI